MANGKIVLVPAKSATTVDELVRRFTAAGYPEADCRKAAEMAARDELYLSECGTYQVAVRRGVPNGFEIDMVHLSIKRCDKEPIHDWRDLQTIKNQIVGAECEAIELYPAESRRVDSANQYHLWCCVDPMDAFPVGFTARLVTDMPVEGTKQRSFTD